MTLRAAQQHERQSNEHAKKVIEAETRMWLGTAADAAAWTAPIRDNPPLSLAEMKVRESRIHVDSVQDMVPFWIRGVEAAERGEVLSLEEFLDSLPKALESWGGCGWGETGTGVGWGGDGGVNGGWGPAPEWKGKGKSAGQGRGRGRGRGRGYFNS